MTTRAAPRARPVPVGELADRVDALRRQPDAGRRLAELLPEQSSLYAGRGTTEAERLRGYVLASFETAGLPDEALPFVLEELETGRNPYTVAAAARALRGASTLPAEAPELLVAAIARLRGSDDYVSFERFAPSPAAPGTATCLAELASGLADLGPRARDAQPALEALLADAATFSPAVRAELARAAESLREGDSCCWDGHVEARPARAPTSFAAAPAGLAGLALEDQDGARLTFAGAFAGRPTALAFFYTRCMNPEKCSLTVTRLARLATRLDEAKLDANVAGVSYDPRFDRPERLRRYGVDRGMAFSPRCSLLRTVGPFGPLADAFELGVGFGPVTVNRHRLDLVVLDSALRVTERFERRLWHEDTVLDALRAAR
jgi:cytochrome oxidase Cu insertion factor (SCO1/SenC/PrrC family)